MAILNITRGYNGITQSNPIKPLNPINPIKSLLSPDMYYNPMDPILQRSLWIPRIDSGRTCAASSNISKSTSSMGTA